MSFVYSTQLKYLLEEAGDVVSAATGPGERLAVLGQLCSHDASWLMAWRSTNIT